MRCKNKTCMFIGLGRGCCDDKSCDGFVPPSFYEKLCIMSKENMAKFSEARQQHDCTDCPFLKRCDETGNYCEGAYPLIWLSLLAEWGEYMI